MKGFSLSVGWKAGLIAVVGLIIVSMAGSIYTAAVYRGLVDSEFIERIITTGQGIARTVLPVLDDLQAMKPGEKTKKARGALEKQVKFLLTSASAAKDIYYTAVILDNGVVYTGTADKDQSYTLPKAAGSGAETIKGKYKSYPVVYKGRAARQLSFSYGEMTVIVGYSTASISGGVDAARGKVLIAMISGTMTVALVLLAYIFIRIVRPISRITEVSQHVSMGDISDKVSVVKTGDEMETLTRSFRDMSEYINLIAWVSESISNGELVDAFEPKSEKDILGKSFIRMLVYINDFAALLGRVAKGDLTASVVAKSDKDLLFGAFADMAASLKTLVSHIKDKADFLAASSKQLEDISKQGQTTVQQLAETIANISTATSDAAKNSQTASQASVRAEQSAKQGADKMAALLEKMKVLTAEIERSTSSMLKLEAHSEEIKNITAIIKSVADETKLLSFNAAIEAARAGEAGRGFVVVAEEIRKLSEMSTQQAVKISERIKEVRADIAGAVDIVNRESESIKESSQLTQETNSIFLDIVEAVDETASHMESIAATSQQIVASSEEAAAASQEQSSSMEELNAVVSEFTDTSKNLKESTDRFRI